jgi:PTH1 family peptidyl-tRNA hydrolase
VILSRLRWFLGRLVSPVTPGTSSGAVSGLESGLAPGSSEESDMTTADVWLVVGLGNPGEKYAGHRHNVGYLVADELARRLGSPFRAHKSGRADVVESRLGTPGSPGPRLVLARPRSYMNELGGPVKALASFYKVPPERVIAIHDELDIAFGTLRVKLGGGDNGHNGLRSLRSSLGTGDFYRVRAGIGRPPGRQDVSDFVLSNYSSAERKEVPFQVDLAADAVESLITEGLERTQQKFNS